jgi:protein AbiQ
MSSKFKIVKVDYQYCNYLRKFDSKVPYNAGVKELRPFIGVLFMIGKCEYFAPLSSPKPKHKNLKNTMDLVKIEDGLYGVINFNNMIPVTNKNYTVINLDATPKDSAEMKRFNLLRNQLQWLNKNRADIILKSKILYNAYKKGSIHPKVKSRCCNFLLLEEKCREFNNIK